MNRTRTITSAVLLTAASSVLALYACSEPDASLAPGADLARAGFGQPGAHRIYGTPMKVGDGMARTYLVLDEKSGAPLEIGVALTETALEGLPAPMPMPPGGGDGHEHLDSHVYDLTLPPTNPTPYRFVELDWNPGGHEPPGIYDLPHFDFHFYTVEKSVRDGIDPVLLGAEAYQAKASNLPPESQRPPFYVPLSPPGTPPMAVPHMGVHWSDVRSPELQGALGHPENFRPFTTTFIHGSWDGRFIFDEPMVTRAFILGRKAATAPAQRDSVIALDAAPSTVPAGFYPSAYRVAYDAQAKEYRIALTGLVPLASRRQSQRIQRHRPLAFARAYRRQGT